MRLPNVLRLNMLSLPSLRRVLWFLLPFSVATVTIGGVGGFERGKLLIVVAGVILLTLLTLVEIIRTKTLRARSRRMHGLFGAATLLMVVVFALSDEHFSSLFGIGNVTSTTTLSMLFGLIAAWMLWMERDAVRTVMAVCAGWVLGVSVVALNQFLSTPTLGSLSSFAQPTHADGVNLMSPMLEQSGALYAVTILLAFVLLLNSSKAGRVSRVQGWLGGVGVILSMLGLLLTNSTTGFITLAVCALGSLIGFWLIRAQASGVIVALTVVSVIGVILWVVPLVSWMGVAPGVDTILSESTGWQITTRALSEAFWFGGGPETFQTAFLRFVPYAFYASVGTQAWFVMGSSQISHLLATWGVIGTFAILFMQIVPVVLTVRFFARRRSGVQPQHLVLFVVGLSLVLAQVVLLLTASGVAFLWLMMGALLAMSDSDEQEVREESMSALAVGAIVGLGAVLCAVVAVFSVMMIRAERVIQNYQQAVTSEQSTENFIASATVLKEFQPRSANYGVMWINIELLEMSNGRVTAEEGTKEITEFARVLSLQFPKDPLLQIQLAGMLTRLREFQLERAFDSDIANFYLTALALSPEDSFARVEFAQNMVARIQYDLNQNRIPDGEREDVRNALAQATDLVLQARVLLSAPTAFRELAEAIETLQSTFAGDVAPAE